jgi:methylated-DNA-[protein]-cysteine S-methyltransferase
VQPHKIVVFPSKLGWMAIIAAGATVEQLSFGHPTAAAARAAVEDTQVDGTPLDGRIAEIVERLQAYAAGVPDDFRDVRIALGPVGEFRRRVLSQCRRIPYGTTISYAQLAVRAGYPGAARAVGNCMATNRIPLLMPCHRVVCSDGRLGGYSASGGIRTKRRLLALESPTRC